PPRSKTTARRLIPGAGGGGGAGRATPRRLGGRRRRRLLVRRQRQPPALAQARGVDLVVLLAGLPVALEVGDGVVDVGLVPLHAAVGAAAGDDARREGTRHEGPEGEPGGHEAHDTRAPPCFDPPSPAACPSPRGWRAPACCGRRGSSTARPSRKASAMRCGWPSPTRRPRASTSSPTASRAAAT